MTPTILTAGAVIVLSVIVTSILLGLVAALAVSALSTTGMMAGARLGRRYRLASDTSGPVAAEGR